MKFPYIIIDTDRKNINLIQLALEDETDYVCVGLAKNEIEAIQMILEKRPSIVFLNPIVPGEKNEVTEYTILIEISKFISQLPQFIIVSGTEAYAVEGIKHKVQDYLMLPMTPFKVKKAILKFEKDYGQNLDKTLCFKSYGDYRFVDIDEILYLKADNNTTDFIMQNGTTIEAYKTLKYFQSSLPDHFVRIHNSYIINTNFVSRIHFGKSRCEIKNTNNLIPFSKSYKSNVEEIKNTLAKSSFLGF